MGKPTEINIFLGGAYATVGTGDTADAVDLVVSDATFTFWTSTPKEAKQLADAFNLACRAADRTDAERWGDAE